MTQIPDRLLSALSSAVPPPPSPSSQGARPNTHHRNRQQQQPASLPASTASTVSTVSTASRGYRTLADIARAGSDVAALHMQLGDSGSDYGSSCEGSVCSSVRAGSPGSSTVTARYEEGGGM